MLVAAALFMAAVHDFENVVTAVSDVSCNIVQLRYAVFFFGAATAVAVARYNVQVVRLKHMKTLRHNIYIYNT